MPTPESAAFLAKKPTVPPTFDGVDYNDQKRFKQAQDAIIREQWVQVMMARLVREELGKCYRREGVNHLLNCGRLRGIAIPLPSLCLCLCTFSDFGPFIPHLSGFRLFFAFSLYVSQLLHNFWVPGDLLLVYVLVSNLCFLSLPCFYPSSITLHLTHHPSPLHSLSPPFSLDLSYSLPSKGCT